MPLPGMMEQFQPITKANPFLVLKRRDGSPAGAVMSHLLGGEALGRVIF